MAPWISLSSSACRAGPVLFVLVEGVQFAALGPWAQLVRIEADKLPLQFLNYDRAHLQSLTQFAYGPGDDTRVAGADVLEGYQHPHLRRSPLFPYVPNQRQSRPSPQSWEVAGCATGSARLLSAHNWGGLQSLYFRLFLYQVHIVASVASVSRPLLLTLNLGKFSFCEVRSTCAPRCSREPGLPGRYVRYRLECRRPQRSSFGDCGPRSRGASPPAGPFLYGSHYTS